MSTEPTVVWSVPEDERAGKPLVVVLHGYGADERDLTPIFSELPSEIVYASVRAPLPLGPGFSWFDLQVTAMGEAFGYDLDGAISAAKSMLDWVDSVREQFTSVSLLGFSQGMCIATSMLRHRPDDFDVVVGLSGFILPEDKSFFNDRAVEARRPPFFWGRDQEDPVIPVQLVDITAFWLRENVDLTKVLYAGMGHGISAQEIGHISEFLTHNLLKG